MKTLRQISVFIENKPGAVSAPCKVLADAGINIATLSLADTKFFGVLRLLIRDVDEAAAVLEKAGFAVKITEVVAVPVSHEPGSLSKILEVLDEHKVNVEYMYAFPSGVLDKAAIVFRFDDTASAVARLEGRLPLLDDVALFKPKARE